LYTIGIALDEDHRAAIGRLEAIATFDEVVLGGGWVNSGSIRYILRDFAGRPVVPQVVLLRRKTIGGKWPDVTDERLLTRLYSPAEIVRWVERFG
jgi:hypothetical protein